MLRVCVLLACIGVPWRLGALGAMIECAPCDERALSACHPPRGCELVKESGCGCCLTCALAEGAACGVYTESCASSLRCVPRSGDKAPLQALLQGRAVCRSVKRRNQIQREGKPLDGGDKYSLAKKEHSGKNHGKQLVNPSQHLTPKPQRGNHHSPKGTLHTIVNPSKVPSVTTLVADSEYVSASLGRESRVHSNKFKGPCRRKMESILQDLKSEFFHSPEDIYIPNCDKQGFYRSKQCKPSRGRRRGHCWCVDKYGHSLPGRGNRKRPVSCA
ncbi:insulin-like growth factor-binding protein 5 isoform X1 [Stegostoma tigrinum]|uniref:insulin-like growth factor-binding protein 5 isoform X1 n=1 Tax=Stegostoma tigrinum TaxID=3053191 RepID=UPI00202B94E8|nr:insulin-like growth factor-binding protein 5 isoform X1 [Stegostoma tigrinum]